jgi:hypothetical protein
MVSDSLLSGGDVKSLASIDDFESLIKDKKAIFVTHIECAKTKYRTTFKSFNNNFTVDVDNKSDGTYELCGPKVQGNPEKRLEHILIRHGAERLALEDDTFEYIREYLATNDIEGIVFHHRTDDRMCKIRKTDFGIRR